MIKLHKYPVSVNNADIVWRLEGPFDSTYSLALVNREIARALQALGVKVALFSTEGPGDFAPSPAYLIANPDLAAMNALAERIDHEEAEIASRNLYPPRVEDMTCSTNIMHSYAWEETAFPAQWVKNFNAHLSGLSCLSMHVQKLMRDNGVGIPMALSGCGVDHWERVVEAPMSVLDSMSAKGFRFLHVSSFFPRKGPESLLRAWGRAFTNADDVCLIIKTFPNPHNNVHKQIAELKANFPTCAPIYVIEDDMSDADLKALYKRCQVLVAPSCAEGFCLPIAEAMLSGIPAITTGWSGQLDFCNTENSWLVDYAFEQADTHFGLRPSAWAAVNVDALANAMRTAFVSEPECRNAMAQRGREQLLGSFRWEHVATRLIQFYHELQGRRDLPDVSVGWISTWNTKCGIAVYSEHLLAGFKRRPYVLAARSGDILGKDDAECSRCWDANDEDRLDALAGEVAARGLKALVIQWNFGFFHHEHIYRFIVDQKKAGRIIVLDLHATVDPPQVTHKHMINYIPAMELADRVLVHSIADMNRMKSFGLVDNVTLFPLGVLETSFPETECAPYPTIATYGFCLPHKGLEQVVDAIALLREEGKRVDLRLINAEYPIDFSADLVRHLKARIDALGLHEQVTLETRFLPDAESLALLQKVDLVLFAYGATSESASAAVRYGLASGKPTMVTALPIFAEFGDAVWSVPNNLPATLTQSIIDALAHIRSGSETHQKKMAAAEAWRSQHSYAWLSERLEGMINGLYCDVTLIND